MDRALRRELGGIRSLLSLPREHWEALEYDLLQAGFVRSDIPRRLSWRAVKVLYEQARPGTATFQAVFGEPASWSQETHAIVGVQQEIRDLIWVLECVNTPRNGHRPPRPKRIARPGDAPDIDPKAEKLTGEPMTREQWVEFWATGVHPNGPRRAGPEDDLTTT